MTFQPTYYINDDRQHSGCFQLAEADRHGELWGANLIIMDDHSSRGVWGWGDERFAEWTTKVLPGSCLYDVCVTAWTLVALGCREAAQQMMAEALLEITT